MNIYSLIPTQYRLLAIGLAIAVLMALAAGTAAQFQAYRYGEQLQRQGRGFEQQLASRDKLHADTLTEIQRAAAAQQRSEHDKRLKLEVALQADSEIHHRKLTDAKNVTKRLLDRLATADLRLSFLLDKTGAGQHCGVPSTAVAGGLVYGAPRAELDPAHAQRIIGITNDGDAGVIALAACQAYARAVSSPLARDEHHLPGE